MNFNGAVTLSLKAFKENHYKNFENKSYHPVSDTQGHERGATFPPVPFFFSFFVIYFPSVFFFFLIPLLLCLHPQISSFICIRSRGLSGIWAGTYSMGDTVKMFPTLLPVMTSRVIFMLPCPWDAHHWAPRERDSDYLNVNLVSVPIIVIVLPSLSGGKSVF